MVSYFSASEQKGEEGRNGDVFQTKRTCAKTRNESECGALKAQKVQYDWSIGYQGKSDISLARRGHRGQA